MLRRLLTQLFGRQHDKLPPVADTPVSVPAQPADVGRGELDAGDFTSAAAQLQEPLDAQPGSPELRWKMAHAQVGLGDIGSAIGLIAPILTTPQAQPGKQRLLDAAVKALARLSAQSEADRQACAALLGCVLLEQGEFDAAFRCATIVANDPERRLTYHALRFGDDLYADCRAAGLPALVSETLFSTSTRGDRYPAYLCTLPGGMVLGHSAIPMSADKVVYLARQVHNPTAYFKQTLAWRQDMLCLATANHLIVADAGVDEYPGTHVLIGHKANPGHWMLNHFGRLRVLEDLPVPPEAKLLVPDDIGPLARRSLELAGYPAERLTLVPNGRIARCESLLVPSMLYGGLHGLLYWTDEVPHFIRRRLTPTPAKVRPRRILVTRKGAQWRHLRNEDEVLGALADLGFESVELGAMDLDQQIALAAESSAIVGAFGAGMSIVLLAHPGTAVIEIKANLHGVMDIHPKAAAALGVTYAGVIATPIRTSAEPSDLLNADLVCDPGAVRATVIEAMRVATETPR
jgi:capsular polysaccharide biosynthesis protein